MAITGRKLIINDGLSDAASNNTMVRTSIIIPVINEIAVLPRLLNNLQNQSSAPQREVIVSDGGSDDGTLEYLLTHQRQFNFPLIIVHAKMGRALQMNQAAKMARGRDLLFLHADSQLHQNNLLQLAEECLDRLRNELKHQSVAGHFSLKFLNSSCEPVDSSVYFFNEAKTHLNKEDCINGDQGMMLSRIFFTQLGMFNTDLPFMEDTRLAAKIFNEGQWICFQGEISSSARRFEVEGFRKRQTINALIKVFNYIGAQDYLRMTENIYRHQYHTSELIIGPFFLAAHRVSFSRGFNPWVIYWVKAGIYISRQVWQVFFWFDCFRAQGDNKNSSSVMPFWLGFYERNLRWLFVNPVSYALASVLSMIWFYIMLVYFNLTGK